MRQKAFTLIELLIVVAIIAILAAIAVPNFLEAQVRSKVSRVKADQRTIATAMEAYSIDYNRPPVGSAEAAADCSWWGVSGNYERNGRMWSQLTTPVAYITTIPLDPFTEKGSINQNGSLNLSNGGWFYYQSAGFIKSKPPTFRWNVVGQMGYTWSVHSIGPMRTAGKTTSVVPNICDTYRYKNLNSTYDSTNGTTSYGYIYRNNKSGEPVS